MEFPKTDKEYLAHRYISCSDLKLIRQSIKHWKYEKANPKQTDALRFGTAFHSYILEQDKFHEKFRIAELKSFNSKAGEAFLQQCEDDEKEPVLEKQMDTIKEMKQAIMENKECCELLNIDNNFNFQDEEYYIEKPVLFHYYQKDEKPIGCKIKPDYDTLNRNYIIDLKTTNKIKDMDAVVKKIADNDYDMQAYLYSLGHAVHYGTEAPLFIFIFVEKEPPYGIRNDCLDDRFFKTGKSKTEAAIRKLRNYWAKKNEKDYYDGYNPVLTVLDCPQWYYLKHNL